MAHADLPNTSCLLIDIGNTSVTLAHWTGTKLERRIRRPTRPLGGEDIQAAIRSVVGHRRIGGAVVASVVPPVNDAWRRAIEEATGAAPLIVDHRLQLGVGIRYPRPSRIGADRLANAAGAALRYGVPIIVADFGTALTFDVVDHQATYIGGVIAPGLPVMSDYLAEQTALLPHIRLQGRLGTVGKSTAGAMRIGAKIGYRGMVREIVEYLTHDLPDGTVALCATGGYARWVLGSLNMPFHFDPDLTLYGLARIFELNRPDSANARPHGR